METDITPPDQTAILRQTQKQRLKDQAEALLKAYEALEPPQTYAETDRAAKALMSINKALDQIRGPETETTPETLDAPQNSVLEHVHSSDAMKAVYIGVYRRLAKIDARLGRDSGYAHLADSLEAQLNASPNSSA